MYIYNFSRKTTTKYSQFEHPMYVYDRLLDQPAGRIALSSFVPLNMDIKSRKLIKR